MVIAENGKPIIARLSRCSDAYFTRHSSQQGSPHTRDPA
jgi:hypothetical protein